MKIRGISGVLQAMVVSHDRVAWHESAATAFCLRVCRILHHEHLCYHTTTRNTSVFLFFF